MSNNDENIIAVYTAEDAVRDGLFIHVGTIGEVPIYCTANAYLLAGLDNAVQRQGVVLEALESLKKPDPEDTHWQLRVLHQGIATDYECLWVVRNDEGITIMMPEDY